MYDVEKWEKVIGRDGKPIPRPANLGTPCESCPRKSPDREAETTLTEQNWKAYAYFLEVRATCGGCLEGRAKTDPLSRKLLRICDGIQREDDERKQTQAIQYAVMIAAAGRV